MISRRPSGARLLNERSCPVTAMRSPQNRVRLLQYVLRCQHGQKIDRAGQALDRQHQAVKLPVMVGMRIFRQSIQRAGERNAVGCIFHSSTSFSSYEKLYEA